MKKYLVALLVLALSCWMVTLCRAEITLDGCSDYELSNLSVRWGPDPNASVGLLFQTGSDTVGKHVYVGPVVQFQTGSIYRAALTTILPTGWAAWTDEVPLRPFGRLSLTWDVGNLDGNGNTGSHHDIGTMHWVAATGTEIFPEWAIHPYMLTGVFGTEGGKTDTRVMFGAMWRIP